MKKTITDVVRYALVSLFSFLFIGSTLADAPTPSVVWYGANAKEAFKWGAKSGYTLSRDRVSTAEHQIAADGSKITIVDDGAYGVQIRPSANYNAFSVLVKYSNFTPNSNGDTVIATARNPNAGNRIGFYVNSDGTKMRSIIGNVLNGSTGEVDNAFPENGEFCFIYDKGASTIKVYARAAGDDDFAQIFSFTDNNSNKDTITIAGVRENNQAGAHNVSGGTACNPVGMEIEGIALFDGSVLSTSEVGSYVWPEGRPVINATITAESVKVSDINGLSELAEAISDDIVKLTLVGTKTLEFDEAFKCEECQVVYDGALKLLGEAAPADLAKFSFSCVVKHGWYKYDGAKVIAVNFNRKGLNNNDGGGSADNIIGENEDSGALDCDLLGKGWLQVDARSSDWTTDAFVYDTASDTEVSADALQVKWSSNNNYMWTNPTCKFLRGYLDDGGNHAQFSAQGIPFESYDVIVYFATDSGAKSFAPVTVNNKTYCFQSGETVAGNSNWGQSQTLTPAYGTNALCIKKLSGDLDIVGGANANDARGGIAAVVIVEVQATIKNVDCGSAYNISDANSFTEDIVNLNFVDAGGELTLDVDPAREFNIVSKGAIKVTLSSGVDVSTIAKLNYKNVEGGIKFVFTNGEIPASAPAAGVTYRWEGETALTAIPFAQDQVAGTLEIACPLSVAADAKVEVFRNKNIVFDGEFALNASAFICGNKVVNGDPTPSQTITQNAGTITLSKEYTGANTTSEMPLLFAHWPSTCIYNLVGGSITAENGNVMFGRDGTIAMTVGGGDTTATFKARGIFRNGRDNTSSITIGQNGTVLVGVGGIDFGANKKVVLNGGTLGAYDNATITTTMNLEVAAASTINVADGKTLTLAAPLSGSGAITKTGAGKLVITGSRANFTGTITIAEGSYDIGSVRDFATITGITTSGTGSISATAIVADDGEVKIINVPVGTSLVIYDLDGTTQLPTTVVGTTVTAKSSIVTDGEACLYDWTFDFGEDKRHQTEKNNYLVSVGKNKSALEWDTGWQKTTDEHYAERAIESEDFTYGKALNTKGTPYSNDFTINYPTEWTCVVAGIVPNNENAALIAFGTSTGGSIAILKGATDTEVIIARTTGNSAYKSLATMQVANALTTSHTYAFVKTADSITVYLDGNLWNVTPVSNVSFGNRVQVGSIHGGKQNTMIESSKAATNDTAIQAVRIFEGALGPNALKQLADEFPYNSPNGTFAREFAEGDDTWTLADSWTNTKTSEVADLPAAGSTLNISAAGAASITVDLTEETDYEAMTFSGAAMTFKAGAAEAINIGLTTVASPITIEYGSISIANGPFVVSGEGSVAFDYSAAPVSTFAKIGFVALTGTTDDLGDKVTCTALPSAPAGREISFGYNAEHKAYGVTTVVNREATTLYLKSSTTLSDDTLFALTEDGEADMPRLFAEDEIVVPADVTMTIPTTALAIPLTTPIQGAGTIAVTGATLTEAAPLFTVDEDWAGAVEFTNVTVTGADLNKYGNENTTVKLTGVVGYLKNGVEFEPEVILQNNNLAGLELTDGSSSSPVIFSKVSGNGNFIGNKVGVTQKIAVVDASEHIGQVRMVGGMGVTLGSDTCEVDSAKIAVADDATITFAGQQWIAEGGVTFGETLTVIGEVGSFITMPEPTAIPEITLIDAEGEIVEGDYMLVYAGGKLTVSYAQVEVIIPEIAGTTVEVWVAGSEEAIEPIEGKVMIPYGADMTVLYVVKEGKLFKNGEYMLPLEYANVTADPEIANYITEDDVTVDAGARIEDVDYLDIPAALADATDGDTVIVLQNAVLDSLVVPEGVTLDLNEKTVLINPANITNNGMIVIYDAATAMALIDTHGTIKFGELVTIDVGYQFPAGTTITIVKRSAPGATESLVELPQNSILINLVGAAAKKVINVYPENPQNGALLLAGVIERGSHDVDTIINVGGYTLVGAPLIIGEDGEGMDYETYPYNKAKLISTFIQFNDEMVSEIVGYPVQGCIQLIPGVGVVQTATDLSDFIGTRFLTLNGAEIKDSFDGTIHTYTAEWIKPSATVETVTVDGLDGAATFTVGDAAPHYGDWTADFILTADQDFAKEDINLVAVIDNAQVPLSLTADYKTGDEVSVMDALRVAIQMDSFNVSYEDMVKMGTFTCGVKNNSLKADTTFTIKLVLSDGAETKDLATTEGITVTANVLPTATVTKTTAAGYEAAVEFTAGDIGAGYENWTAEFVLTSDVAIGKDEIKLGGSYAAWQDGAWVDIDFPGCATNEEVSVLGLVGYNDITVKTVFDVIQSFKCGVKNLALKNDATFTLKLVITDGVDTKDICSIDSLKVEAKAVEPVDPEVPQEYDTPAKAQEAAEKMNADDGTIKPEFINVPDGIEKAPYAALFKAVADGNTVTVKFTEAAEAAIKEDLAKPENEATILTPDEHGEATVAAKPGLFYGIKAVGSLTDMAAAVGKNWVMATGDTVKVLVPTVEGNAAFFQPICSAKAPAAE